MDILPEPIGKLIWGRLGSATQASARPITGRRALYAGVALAGVLVLGGITAYVYEKLTERDNVILYVFDAMRADSLGECEDAKGTRIPIAPNLRQLAREGIEYTNAHSSSLTTKTSMAGIITGEPHLVHEVRAGLTTVPEMPTIATELSDRGFDCIAIVTNPFLEPEVSRRRIGFSRGYAHYLRLKLDTLAGGGARKRHYWESDQRQASILFKMIDNRRVRPPFFAQLHCMRTHSPYLTLKPTEFTGTLHQDSLGKTREEILLEDWKLLDSLRTTRWRVSDADLPRIRAIYYEAVRAADREFGNFIAGLKQRGLYDRTTIIVTADHGERLGGLDEVVGHVYLEGRDMSEQLLKVPLIIKPGRKTSEQFKMTPRVDDSLVSNIQILQTLRSIYGGKVDTESMTPPLNLKERNGDVDIIAGYSMVSSLIEGRTWRKVTRDNDGRYHCYDIRNDPYSSRELPADPALVKALEQYESYGKGFRESRGIRPEPTTIAFQKKLDVRNPRFLVWAEKILGAKTAEDTSAIDEETRRQFEALGYLAPDSEDHPK